MMMLLQHLYVDGYDVVVVSTPCFDDADIVVVPTPCVDNVDMVEVTTLCDDNDVVLTSLCS